MAPVKRQTLCLSLRRIIRCLSNDGCCGGWKMTTNETIGRSFCFALECSRCCSCAFLPIAHLNLDQARQTWTARACVLSTIGAGSGTHLVFTTLRVEAAREQAFMHRCNSRKSRFDLCISSYRFCCYAILKSCTSSNLQGQ